MPPPITLVSKLKVHLKMAIQRLRMLQQKSTAIAKQQRRSMAELLAEGKLESARIRVENIIRSDITTELHEILELYCELLLARIQLLEQPSSILSGEGGGGVSGVGELDSGLEEAVRSIVFAAPRTEIKELQQSRILLVEKFGKEFALECVEGKGVPERVLKRLRVETPKRELVDAYLREIGRTYAVRFPGDPDPEDEEGDEVEPDAVDGEAKGDDDDDDQPGSGGKAVQSLETPLQAEELSRATPPRDFGDSRPFRIAPPSPSTENVAPKLKLPGVDKGSVRPAAKPRKASVGATQKPKEKSADGGGPGGKIPDVDELAKRFAALKKT